MKEAEQAQEIYRERRCGGAALCQAILCVFELGFHLGFWIVLVLPFLLLIQGGTCPDILIFSISFVRIHVETRVFAGACM